MENGLRTDPGATPDRPRKADRPRTYCGQIPEISWYDPGLTAELFQIGFVTGSYLLRSDFVERVHLVKRGDTEISSYQTWTDLVRSPEGPDPLRSRKAGDAEVDERATQKLKKSCEIFTTNKRLLVIVRATLEHSKILNQRPHRFIGFRGGILAD